jgi:hypothetical protein
VSATQARSARAATDPIGQFFDGLTQPGHIATFESESATLRFDIKGGAGVQRWHVTVHDGDVTVTRRADPADVVLTAERPQIEAILTGRVNATAAMLRGLLHIEGSVAALMMFQRCLPGPPGSKGRVAPISSRTVMADHDQKPRRSA